MFGYNITKSGLGIAFVAIIVDRRASAVAE
jgi:hypothetical protein